MKDSRQAGFHLVAVILVILVVGVIGFAGYKVIGSQDSTKKGSPDGQYGNQQQGQQQDFASQYKDACKDRDVTFSSGPMPANQLGFIEPLGKVNDGHVTPTDHVYVNPTKRDVADNTYDAIMPADGTIVEIAAMPSQYIGDKDQQTASEDHRLVISHSCRYFSIYIHVHKLDPALAQLVSGLQPNQSKRVNLDLKAGDKVGKVGGNGFDWTSVDISKRLSGFITPANYSGEAWKIHTVSPFDMYTGTLKSQLEAKSLRAVAPLGGKIDWDQPGKLIGNWFREGSGDYRGDSSNREGRYWDGHLSIAPDYIDGKTTVFSIGNWDGKAKQLAVRGGADPAKIATGDGPVKLELTSLSYQMPDGSPWSGGAPAKGMKVSTSGETAGTVLVEVQQGEKLRVEKFIGKTANQVDGFTSAAQIYQR